MNRYDNEAIIPNADIDRRVRKQISRGIDYGQYVFAYGWKHGFAWFSFGFSIALALIFIDTRLTGYDYDASEWIIMPLVFGVLFGAPVFSLAIMSRRAQYDQWVQDTVEVQNDMTRAVQPVKETIRPFVTKNDKPTSKTIAVGKFSIDPVKMGEWADVILSRDDLAIVRDDIPSGIFDNVTTQWRRREIQTDLINLGWAEWTNASQGSIKLTANGVDEFDKF